MSFKDRYRHGGPVEDGHDLRGLICQREGCGQTMVFVHTLADVGAFCSEACRNQAYEQIQRIPQKRTA